ncbi:Probable O-methyltransferase 3 [Linum grandiflorum]
MEAETQLWNHTTGYIKSMTVQCAIELGIADAIHSHGSPMTLVDLVAGLGIPKEKASFLSRLMRMLVHLGYFKEDEQGRYWLTPLSDFLVKKNPFNAASYVFFFNNPMIVDPWRHMNAWFKSAGTSTSTPFAFAHGGKEMYQVAAENPRGFGKLLNEAMGGDSWLFGKVLVSKCKSDFEGLSSIVDVGGNTGVTAKAIAEAFPDIKCTVFDLPHVIEQKEDDDQFANLDYVSGDMFNQVPSADAVFLKWVLIDWGDESCLQILKECKKAARKKVMIVDHVRGHESCMDASNTETLLLVDLANMAAIEGVIRNEQEWDKLFHEAGFSSYTITPIHGYRTLIQLFP